MYLSYRETQIRIFYAALPKRPSMVSRPNLECPPVLHGSPDGDGPGSRYDWAMLSVAMVFAVPFILANFVIILHRNKNYFKALGGVDLIIGTSFAGLVWIAANFVTNHHFPRKGMAKECPLWTFFLQLPLGGCLWLLLISLRLFRLHILCTTDQQMGWLKTWAFYVPGLLSPAIIFSIIATAFHVSKIRTEGGNLNCNIEEGWKYPLYLTVPPLYISLAFLLLFWLRSETDFLFRSERRHTIESTMMVFMFYLLDAVIFLSDKQKNAAGRCFLTFCVCWLVFIDFWVRMWKPIYLCLFKLESEMKKFEDELRWCGASFFDKIQTAANVAVALHYASGSISIPSSQLHDGDWILRTIDLVLSETAECQEEVEQLEQQKARLFLKIKELKESLVLLGSSSLENGSQKSVVI